MSFLQTSANTIPYNDNPEGFEDWIFRVAENLKRDFANRVRNRDFKTEDIDNPVIGDISSDDYSDGCESEERIERLKQAFSIVLSSDVGVYKVLTWLAQFVFRNWEFRIRGINLWTRSHRKQL